jgi:hypothetical protein
VNGPAEMHSLPPFLADLQRVQIGDREPDAALLDGRGHQCHVSEFAKLIPQGVQSGGVDAVVIGEENFHGVVSLDGLDSEMMGRIGVNDRSFGSLARSRSFPLFHLLHISRLFHSRKPSIRPTSTEPVSPSGVRAGCCVRCRLLSNGVRGKSLASGIRRFSGGIVDVWRLCSI